MAVGTYGNIRSADVSPEDVEIILNYTPNRDETDNFVLTKLDAPSILQPYYNNNNTGGAPDVEILGGLYNLRLPAEQFNALGIYTLFIRPAQIRTTILDCGVLSSLPNVKGIIIDLNAVPSEYRNKFVSQGLVGFRIEYLNDDGTKIPNFFRLITSSFFCEPVVQNVTNSSQKSVRYRYTENNTNLIFCTLTPSSAPTNKPNATPYIGQPNQNIIITNTFFNPITMDIEIVEHDISTLAIALYGNQTKSMEDGIYTIYDTDNNIYKQYNLYEIRDQFNELLYEVRQDRGSDIDFSKNFTNITE
ncbi:hypothetical protein N9P74_00070 [bacterium]|nr:hypothetical protein [bacterium]MDB0072846.1 hypothetical protein [bacterium]MDB4235134.1 hypothetical protein [bacterium]MDB4352193.1 hypothetical protein [Porticoccaceae bacterium]